MANITGTAMTNGKATVTRTTMTASDTLVYNASKNQILILDNVTAGILTPIIDGNGGTTVPVPGVGVVDVSAGFNVGPIAAGANVAIPLNMISKYLQGTIAITGAVGIKATLLEF